MPLICPRQGWVVSEDSGGAPPRAQRPWKSSSDRLTGRDCCAMYPFKLGRGVFPAWADIYWSGHVSDVVGVAEDAGGNSSTAERNDGCFLSSEKITPGLIAWRCLCHSSSNNTEINNLMTDPVGPSSAPRPFSHGRRWNPSAGEDLTGRCLCLEVGPDTWKQTHL